MVEGKSFDFEIKFKTFKEFLEELEYAIARIIVKNENSKKPEESFERVSSQLNDRIQKIADNKIRTLVSPQIDVETVTGKTLYVYDYLYGLKCYRYKHLVVPKKFIAEFLDVSGKIALPVHYCENCGRYFIGSEMLKFFKKRFGDICVITQKAESFIEKENTFICYRDESLLHKLGYNVIEGKMSTTERQMLLLNLIISKKIGYYEVCANLQENIRRFSNRDYFKKAVSKWDEDLRFIGKAVLDGRIQK